MTRGILIWRLWFCHHDAETYYFGKKHKAVAKLRELLDEHGRDHEWSINKVLVRMNADGVAQAVQDALDIHCVNEN